MPHDLTQPSFNPVTINEVVSLEWSGTIALIVIDSPPVNALSQAVRAGISQGLAAALAAPGVRGVVLRCAGRTFCAGADISEFGKPATAPDLNDVLAEIEASPVPVVAALHGTALGGGLEVALACHHRVAAAKARLGLPEVTLGLLPGAGGTQRTPRLVGVKAALDLIAGGKPATAAKALEIGLIDEMVEDAHLTESAVASAERLASGDALLRRARDLAVDLTPEAASAAAEAYRAAHPRDFVGFKAPANILKAIHASSVLGFDEGLARERELFNELMDSDESAAQRHLFFAERAAGKIADLDPAARPLPITCAAVVGAGTMGSGITIALLSSDISVALIDGDVSALTRARTSIEKTLRSAVSKGRLSEIEAERQLAGLTLSKNLAASRDADLVVEAVFENLALKARIFSELDGIVRPDTVLASNTSFLDLDVIAEATSRPERVVGLHFFAPANVMRLLEVVRGAQTSPSVLATAMALGRRLSKVAIVSGVCDGFIANRIMARRGEAADALILEGALPQDIDRVMKTFGFPMGVFEMLDLVGLDVIGWDKAASAGRTVQEILCETGRWGRKTGGGYYDYGPDGSAVPSPVALAAVETIRTRQNRPQRTFTDAELVDRLLDPLVNEAVRVLEEGIAQRASDIDMALVAGYGWPVYRGGPMFFADTIGLSKVAERLRARHTAGEALTPSPLLERHAAEHRGFVRV